MPRTRWVLADREYVVRIFPDTVLGRALAGAGGASVGGKILLYAISAVVVAALVIASAGQLLVVAVVVIVGAVVAMVGVGVVAALGSIYGWEWPDIFTADPVERRIRDLAVLLAAAPRTPQIAMSQSQVAEAMLAYAQQTDPDRLLEARDRLLELTERANRLRQQEQDQQEARDAARQAEEEARAAARRAEDKAARAARFQARR